MADFELSEDYYLKRRRKAEGEPSELSDLIDEALLQRKRFLRKTGGKEPAKSKPVEHPLESSKPKPSFLDKFGAKLGPKKK